MWRFSLSGVQLKLSMSWFNDRLAMPADTIDGKWIVKFGGPSHPELPEVEWSTMEWARAAGIETPATRLVPLVHLDGIPPEYTDGSGELSYAIERFDRGEGRLRIHIEDFAQVLSADDKYQGHSYETIGNVIAKVCGREDLREYVRRLVFMTLSGNADAHLKNWSLIYPDGVHPRLSPAYDLVSVIVYPQYSRTLALNFNRSKRFEDVSLDGFARFARKIGLGEAEVCGWVQEDVTRILTAWREDHDRVRFSAAQRERVERHLALLREAPGSIASL
jgi:serine/threonine-protein kinase HipA